MRGFKTSLLRGFIDCEVEWFAHDLYMTTCRRHEKDYSYWLSGLLLGWSLLLRLDDFLDNLCLLYQECPQNPM